MRPAALRPRLSPALFPTLLLAVLPSRRLLPLCALAALALPALPPARALDFCEVGLAVITPDGASGTVSSDGGSSCGVTLAAGGSGTWPADLLMPDFGAPVDPAEASDPGLAPGLYACAAPDGTAAFPVEITEDGFYVDEQGGEGTFALEESGAVRFLDGPFLGREARVADGMLYLSPPGGGAPATCLLQE